MAETCDPDNELYNTTAAEGPDMAGIFDFEDERNPIADHSVVFVPYCSADVFLGNATTEYGPDLTIQHKGSANGNAGLDHLASTFPQATEVVVIGESAGSIAAPLYGALVADRLPDARVGGVGVGAGPVGRFRLGPQPVAVVPAHRHRAGRPPRPHRRERGPDRGGRPA